jgi:glycosyltransferase involved in cell wall biosynthesis
MNVGLVVPGFSADEADWCIPALRHLTRSLASTDDLRVIAVRYPYRATRYTVDGVEVIALGGAVRRGRAAVSFWRTALDVLRNEHRRRSFDVLHAFWATESGLLAAMAGRMLRVPTLVSLAGGELVALPAIGYGDQRSAWERLKVAASLRLASAVSAGSCHLIEHARHHVGGRTVHLLPLGVDLELFKPNGTGVAGEPRLVHVSTLTGVKDQATLLRAFAHLRRHSRPAATLDIVGDGPLRPDLERLAADLDVSSAVHFHGAADHAALPPVYGFATAFVLSSRHEAQGMVAIEAAACGVPVVGTRVGVVPELTSAVAPVGAAEALSACVAAVLADPDPHARAALEQARTNFGLARSAARFREVYASLLSG